MEVQSADLNEAVNLIYKILNQGDSRYTDNEGEYALANFLTKKAILIEEKEIPSINKPEKAELDLIYGKQKEEKYIAKILLNEQGFKDNDIFFERRFFDLRPDVLVEAGKRLIIVECCSCRINKIVKYLSEDAEVWVFTQGIYPWEKFNSEKMHWFLFKKGPNWNLIEKFREQELKDLKEVKSPFDEF